MIIGCDFHTRYQQIAMVNDETGELVERRLDHESGEADKFYRELQGPVRVGIEAVYPALRQDYQRLKFRRGHAVAKVAIARKFAVRMYWMLRRGNLRSRKETVRLVEI